MDFADDLARRGTRNGSQDCVFAMGTGARAGPRPRPYGAGAMTFMTSPVGFSAGPKGPGTLLAIGGRLFR